MVDREAIEHDSLAAADEAKDRWVLIADVQNHITSRNVPASRTPKRATMLLLVLIWLKFSDLLFAMDSLSASLAQVNDLFLVYSAVFAMLGLRATCFIIDVSVKLFLLLKYGVAIVLTSIGAVIFRRVPDACVLSHALHLWIFLRLHRQFWLDADHVHDHPLVPPPRLCHCRFLLVPTSIFDQLRRRFDTQLVLGLHTWLHTSLRLRCFPFWDGAYCTSAPCSNASCGGGFQAHVGYFFEAVSRIWQHELGHFWLDAAHIHDH